jgi:hypothetical protein
VAATATLRQKLSHGTTIINTAHSLTSQTTPNPLFAIALAPGKEFSLQKKY